MKKFLFVLCGIALALTYVGCSSDDGEENGGDGGNSGSSSDYIATTQVKTIKISVYNITIYEDYFYRYMLSVYNGNICLWPYYRKEGNFSNINIDNSVGGIKEFDNIDKLQDLTEKHIQEAKENSLYFNGSINKKNYSYAEFAPGRGFVAWFVAENGKELYIRMRATNYTLNDEGSLETVTLEYQLF